MARTARDRTTTKKPATTSGLPTAKGFLPQGTEAHVCIGYNRACKTLRIALPAKAGGYDHEITDGEMDAIADDQNVKRPGGEETRAAVRAALMPPYTAVNSEQAIAEAVEDGTGEGNPFQYRDRAGRLVLWVPIPISE